MYIMGIPSIHNPAWALIENGQVIVSIEEDRLHRQKNRFGIVNRKGDVDVLQGWQYCLDVAGISAQDIDYLAFGFNPSSLHQKDQADYRRDETRHERVFVQQHLLLNHLRRVEGCKAPAYYLRHHLAHASAVYYLSHYNKSAIVTIDGWGEDETVGVFRAEGAKIETLATIILPDSLGELYTKLTTTLGWGKDDAGKTMGLAAYGSLDPSAERLIRHGSPTDEDLKLDTSLANNLIDSISPRLNSTPLEQWHADLAARIQFELEDAILYIVKWAYLRSKCSNLCLGGGVSLNSVANYRILLESGFDNIFIQPACGDAGLPVGASLGLYFHLIPKGNRFPLTQPYLGQEYTEAQMKIAIGELPHKYFADSHLLTRYVSQLILEQKIIAWFQGRSEFGPRALGHRSILADPRKREMKDNINLRVKHREPFRPFAPSVLEERASEYFDINVPSPFMLFVSPIRPSKLNEIQAVAHVDGTARLHTVTAETDKLFYQLISEFAETSGVPVLLNTSFNLAGDPIVESPEDAVKCFSNSGIDFLVLGPFLVSKSRV